MNSRHHLDRDLDHDLDHDLRHFRLVRARPGYVTLRAGVIVLSLFALGACSQAGTTGQTGSGTKTGAGGQATQLPAVKSGAGVVVSARVVPVRGVALGFRTAGAVARVLVEEGQQVTTGTLMVQLDSQAEASGVLQAEAELRAAQAAVAKVENGTGPAERAAGDASVGKADAGAQAAEAAVASAKAALAKLEAGGEVNELAILEHRVEQAKNMLFGFQSVRDALCGNLKKDSDHSACNRAQADVQSAEESVKIAQLQLAGQKSGARPEELAAQRATVNEKQAALGAAQAEVRSAQADRDKLKGGADAEDLAAARAKMDAATAAVEQARLRMDGTQLRAPFAGTVAAVQSGEGEQVQPGAVVVRLADTREWQVETDDLSELNVVGLAAGDRVAVTIDAVPGLELPGTIRRLSDFGEERQGDVIYKATIQLDHQDPRLRWNMTASVHFGGR